MMVQEILNIGDVLPGMRLAVAVSDDAGRVLVPAAVELTESLLESLRRRGVAELHVEREQSIDPALLAARRAECEARLAQLFRNAGDSAETTALHRAILAFRMENCA